MGAIDDGPTMAGVSGDMYRYAYAWRSKQLQQLQHVLSVQILVPADPQRAVPP
jgi:hypothetical protein